MKNKANHSTGYYRLAAYAATCVIMLLAVSAVTAVRAYLTAASNEKSNVFASANITYTNIDINEPNGKNYSFTVEGALYKSGGSGDKTATITNPDGDDKKPVFVRVALTMDIYDSSGVNITRSYPQCKPTYDQKGSLTSSDTQPIPTGASWSTTADAWTMVNTTNQVGTNTYSGNLTYAYYNAIVVPGDETFNVFDSVTIANAADLPDGAEVKIRVIADTVQAVAVDTQKWTAADYTNDEVTKVWKDGKVPTPDISALNDAQKAARTPAPVTWADA